MWGYGMQSSDYRMFSEEIARLEAEALEVQHLIINHTERLRLIEQRILALRSVVEGTEARTTAMMPGHLDRAISERPLPTESDIRAERGALSSALFGVQRAFAPTPVDAASYRGSGPAVRQPVMNRIGVTKRGTAPKAEPVGATATKPAADPASPHVDTTS